MKFAGSFGSFTKPLHITEHKPCEDSVALICNNQNTLALAGIFDGVGGMPQGSMASSLASAHFNKISANQLINPLSLGGEKFLLNLFIGIHKEIKRSNSFSRTTATGALFGLNPNKDGIIASVLSIGDSRLYSFRPQSSSLLKLTKDTVSWANDFALCEKLDNANCKEDLTPEELNFFHHRNEMDFALGSNSLNFRKRKPFIAELPLDVWYLFTTDGVPDNLTSVEIRKVLIDSEGDPVKANHNLLQAAYDRSLDANHFRSHPDDISSGIVFLLDQ